MGDKAKKQSESQDLYKSIKRRCMELDINLTTLSKDLGINYSVLQSWKYKPPIQIINYLKIQEYLEEKEKEKGL